MRYFLTLLLLLLAGCPAAAHSEPPCVHDKPHQAMDQDPLSLEWWENEVAFEGTSP